MFFTMDGSQISEAAAKRLGYTRDQEPDEIDEVEDRLEALERAVAILAMQAGDNNGNGEEEEDNEDDETGDEKVEPVHIQMANREVEADRRAFTKGSRDQEAGPPSPASINAANRLKYDATTSQSVSAGGSPSATPAPDGVLRNSYATGTINKSDRRTSATAPTLNMGKTSSWGTDRAALRTADRYRRQTTRTNTAIASINNANRQHYGVR